MTLSAEENVSFEFHRCIDGLVYKFEPDGHHSGKRSWRRVDLDLYLRWTGRAGWIVTDDSGNLLSRPWEVEKEAQGALPPDGFWVSRA
jgi:hypothetical protein